MYNPNMLSYIMNAFLAVVTYYFFSGNLVPFMAILSSF